MARVGQEMVNPVTRERFVWRETAASTGGSYCEFDLHLGEGATVARPHVHPHQQEDFRVESGTLRLRIGGQQQTLRAGDERTVVAGTPHAWANIGAGEAHVLVRLTPALRVEDFFETFCGLGRDGKLTSTGMPGNPLQLAVWAFAFRREIGLPSAVAQALAMPLVAILAAFGRLTGYRSRYARYAQ
jgi:quercetin dioxygenase-like cupin family protein